MIGRLYLLLSFVMAVMMVIAASRADYLSVCIEFVGALAWFNLYLIRNERRQQSEPRTEGQMTIRFYHWWIYLLFRRVWNPIFRAKPHMAQLFIELTQRMIDKQAVKS
jgi:hypothetical protein